MKSVSEFSSESLNRTEIKTLAKQLLTDLTLQEHVIDSIPAQITFADGVTRVVPLHIHQKFSTWNENPDLSQESKIVYQAYKQGDLIDIGSFHGFYSFLLSPKAQKHNKFISIDANPRIFHELLSTIQTLSKIFPDIAYIPIPCVAGNGAYFEKNFFLGEKGHPSLRDTKNPSSNLKSVRIDELVKIFDLKPTFIKIDVEGAEGSVLEGMKETLSKFHPTLMLEFHPQWMEPGMTTESLSSLLQGFGYHETFITKDQYAIRTLWSTEKTA